MSVIVVVNSSADIGKAGNYITGGGKTTTELISAKDCSPSTAIQEMKGTKKLFGKEGGRTYKHYVQSFNKEAPITPLQAHEIAQKWVDNSKFEGYEVLMATHIDQEHIHTHFLVNSVSFIDGKKFQQSNKDLQKLKELSNKISKEYGLDIPERSDNITANNSKKYRAIERHYNPDDNYTSEIVETAETIDKVKEQATSWENFLQLMNQNNYQVKWQSPKTGKEYKYVTYTHKKSGKKFRCRNLSNTFKMDFSKEGLTNEIQGNRRREEQQSRNDRARTEINWGEVESNLSNEEYRCSEHSSDEVIRAIQQEVREIEDRVGRATGRIKEESKPEPKGDREKDRGTKGSEQDTKRKHKSRDDELER